MAGRMSIFACSRTTRVPWPEEAPELWAECLAAIERWKARGVNIDGVWPRTVGEIDAAVDGWLRGEIKPVPVVWTIWGYHVLTDVNNQYVIEDPYYIIGAWRERLRVYPPALKAAVLRKYVGSLKYWRHDYHYAHKVERGDVVFLAGMAAKLVHEVIQVLFALNETYFAGDGANLAFAERFAIVPQNFATRVRTILYPPTEDVFARQYGELMALIDEVLVLAQGDAGYLNAIIWATICAHGNDAYTDAAQYHATLAGDYDAAGITDQWIVRNGSCCLAGKLVVGILVTAKALDRTYLLQLQRKTATRN